jgi:ribosome-associated protein
VIVIKAQQFRTQEKNREDALQRLQELIRSATVVQRSRKATKPTRASQTRRMDSKKRQGQIKAGRGRVEED